VARTAAADGSIGGTTGQLGEAARVAENGSAANQLSGRRMPVSAGASDTGSTATGSGVVVVVALGIAGAYQVPSVYEAPRPKIASLRLRSAGSLLWMRSAAPLATRQRLRKVWRISPTRLGSWPALT
jgi:hypothetical protein